MYDKTMTFSVNDEKEIEMKKTLTAVYDALVQKGYNPVNFRMVCIDSVVGMCCDSVDCKHFRIGQPVECIFHIVPSILVL